ncbi:MAG: glycoside hydrolase family 5 protein [Lentisphaerae bacterium]|nr:glycoside hydrolase family 5 protein [Lentisphaerota bacterium]MCP4100009.1 glycoside hydrolase family 5 protein [Lentisphaerota bacterium]
MLHRLIRFFAWVIIICLVYWLFTFRYDSSRHNGHSLKRRIQSPDVFWRSKNSRKGANFFNIKEQAGRIAAAHKFGLSWIRLTPSKWHSSISNSVPGDFLIGHGAYKGLNKADLAVLEKVLDDAMTAKVKVVLTFLDIPGHRWSQHNGGKPDRRIWQSFEEQKQAIQFFTDIASALRYHPALVGINPINEPCPELCGIKFNDWYTDDYQQWTEKIKGTPQDLNLFYDKLVRSIRKVAPDMPVILDSGFFATPWAFKILRPVSDENTYYSFHVYEPCSFTFQRPKAKYSYPGIAPFGQLEKGDNGVNWDRKSLENVLLKPVIDWQRRYGIPSKKIIAGEFGVFRTAVGADKYLSDLISLFNHYGWHWAFYSFREDSWDKMDYELGTGTPSEKYWNNIQRGKLFDYSTTKDNKLVKNIKNGL